MDSPSVLRNIRTRVVTGLLTLVPIMATVYVILFLFNLFDGMASPLIDPILGFHIPGLGLIVSLILIYLLGATVTNIVGKRAVQWSEAIVARVPIAKTIYSATKQITEAVGGQSGRAFKRAVLVEYPRAGSWAIAFVTAESVSSDGKTYLYLFVATTPNPTSGMLLVVLESDVVDAGISVEEGLKAIISGGLIPPDLGGFRSGGKKTGQPEERRGVS